MFHFTKDYGLFVGRLGENVFHKHYSIQISVSEKNTMLLKVKDSKELLIDHLLLESNVSHRLISPEIQLTILVNPLSILGHYLNQKTGGQITATSVSTLFESLRLEFVKLKCEN